MYALRGYIDRNQIITNENIDQYEGCSVIITVLDPVQDYPESLQNRDLNDDGVKAAKDLSGIWASYDMAPVDKMVRNLRKGRRFDL